MQRFAFALLERAEQQLSHALAEISTEKGVQQRIDARIEVGDEERERREECVEVGVTLIRVGPIKPKKSIYVQMLLNYVHVYSFYVFRPYFRL